MSIISRLRADAIDAATDGLQEAAQRVLRQAQANIPIGDPGEDPDPGVELRESGRIEKDGKGYIVVFETRYAAKQHEDQRLSHPRGGGAKYLERAITEIVPTLDGIVSSKVRARMAAGLK